MKCIVIVDRRIWQIAGIFLLICILSGCRSVDIRGQFVSDSEIAQIEKDKPTSEKLTEIVGTPTYVADYSPGTWYYMQRSMSRVAWLNPKVMQQRIVKVTLDSNKKVSQVMLVQDTYDDTVVLHSKYTRSHGTEQNGLQKFVKNIGRFNRSKRVSNRGSRS